MYLLLILILVSCVREHTATKTSNYYTVDTSKAYTWSAGYPQSCSCMEDGVTTAECDLFLCGCKCDITAGICDYNCCCDPDCSADQKTRFGTQGCAEEGYTDKTTRLCYSSNQLYSVNPTSPLSGEATSRAAVGEALCVEKYNYGTPGSYYSDTSLQSNSIFTEAAGQKDYTYGDVGAASSTEDSYFDKGDNIAAFKGSSTTLYATRNGYFSLPGADFSGACNDNNYVAFEENVETRSCERKLSRTDPAVFSAQCTNDFSVADYVSKLWIATTPTVVGSSNTGTNYLSSVVNVELGMIKFVRLNESITRNITASFLQNNCGTTAYSSYSAYQSAQPTCVFGNNEYGVPFGQSSEHVANIPICANMITGVDYTIEHAGTSAGTITKVVADITITDVPFKVYDKNTTSSMVTQSFSASFRSAYTGTVSEALGNQVERAKSGNPGYLMGKPVVFGQAQTAASGLPKTVKQEKAGLQVPSPLIPLDGTNDATEALHGTSTCPQLGKQSALQSIAFGYDVSTGCDLHLNRNQLAGLCCTGTTACTSSHSTTAPFYADSITGYPYFFTNVTTGYVGIYGNADPLDIAQWTTLSVKTSSTTRKWDEYQGICQGMVSGLSYKFLVANSGEHAYPQNKIVSAEVEYITSDWHSSVPYDDTTTTQAFPLTVTASFIFKNAQDLTGYAPPAPPVLFKVPYDVFYPFYVSPAAPKFHQSIAVVILPLLCSAALLLLGNIA